MITGEQVKAARKILGWSQDELGGKAGVSSTVVSTHENGRPVSQWIVDAMRDALEGAGVKFPEGEPPRLKTGAVKWAWDPPPKRG